MVDGISVVGLTPYGALLVIAILIIRAVVRGDLVPRRTYEDMRADRDRALAANDKLVLTATTAAAQVAELLEGNKTLIALTTAMHDAARQQRGST